MLTILVYLGGMIIIGIYCSKKNENVGDFYLGGRKLGPFVTAMSAEASDMSSYLLMGLPGLAYLSGVADVGWTAIGLAIGTYLNWLVVAKKIRIYTHRLDAITIPDFFSRRYHDEKNILMCIAAVVIIIFFIPYTASGFAACGKLFSTLFGVNYIPAMVISAIVIVLYTAMGGFLAASTTDLIQGIVMSIALLIIVFFGIHIAGGFDAVMDNARSMTGYLNLTMTHDPVSKTASPYGFLTICSTLAWALGYFGMPHILLRFMAIEDHNKLKLSRRIAVIWVVIAMGVAILIGIIGNAMTKVGAVPLLEGSASETIIVCVSDLLSKHGCLAAIVAGIVLSGILAATMSTADSQLLVSASSVAEDIFKGLLKKDADDKTVMNVSRITVLVVAVLAYIIAWNPNNTVMGLVSNAWAGLGAAFGPLVVMSLYWKRTNFPGAVAGIVTGALAVIIWDYIPLVGGQTLGKATGLYSLVVGFGLGLIAIIAVSLATKAPSEEMLQEFEDVKANRL